MLAPPPAADAWRLTHLGRLMGHALRRFDERVLTLMAHDLDVPLALSNLAARGQVSAAHIHITRHLGLEGSRLTELATSAGMSKQAMGDLVDQCTAWGLVTRQPDPADGPGDKGAHVAEFPARSQRFIRGHELRRSRDSGRCPPRVHRRDERAPYEQGRDQRPVGSQ